MGMGGWEKPLPQMLQRLGWRTFAVPFHFKVRHPYRFLRNIRAIRTNPLRRLLLDAAAFTGVGWLAMNVVGHGHSAGFVKAEVAGDFAAWADRIWETARVSCALAAERDSATLGALYPAADGRFIRLRTDGGWVVLLDTAMRGHKQFGDMRVGSIVDCLALPGQAADLARAATACLESRGVDLIISNQVHQEWSLALRAAGFRTGPSNYLVALSPALSALAADRSESEFHLNRGDGDGPIHL